MLTLAFLPPPPRQQSRRRECFPCLSGQLNELSFSVFIFLFVVAMSHAPSHWRENEGIVYTLWVRRLGYQKHWSQIFPGSASKSQSGATYLVDDHISGFINSFFKFKYKKHYDNVNNVDVIIVTSLVTSLRVANGVKGNAVWEIRKQTMAQINWSCLHTRTGTMV